MTWKDFEGMHSGRTIWVLGSGRTLDFIPPGFFDDKIVVATNRTYTHVKKAFVCSNHWGIDPPHPHIYVAPEREQVPAVHAHRKRPTGNNVLLVPTIKQMYADFNAHKHWPGRDRFVVGPTSLHLSLHWAVFLGAAHIVLAGADCGLIDDGNNMAGYYDDQNENGRHHKLWEKTLTQMADKIRSFGVSVHSLNPWVTLNLEGHSWSQQ